MEPASLIGPLPQNYGTLAILTFSYWVGLENGGEIAGLASCGLMISILDRDGLMGDFKAGYLTLTSCVPCSLANSLNCRGRVITPLVLQYFQLAYRLGDPKVLEVYPNIASTSPFACFQAAILINLVTQASKKFETKYRIYRFIQESNVHGVPFYLGGYFAIDVCLGSLILLGWQMYNKQKAKDFGLQWLT
ncbi:hypothetical protein H5410_028292, partial [Solanum commersonii]